MDNKTIEKLIHNPKFLFIIPNLICGYKLFYHYNSNFGNREVLFYEVILLFILFIGINAVIYLFLNKALKDKHKVFIILSFIAMFYSVKFDLFSFLIFVAAILLLIWDFKKFIHCKLDYGVTLISFIVIFLFGYNLLVAIYNVSYLTIKSKSYNYELDINVEEKTKTPNIYWIHCDGMLGFNTIKEYFSYPKKDLQNYLKDNQYIYNYDARLVAGHSTQTALAAMFNPYYYDNFFKVYLDELEETYVNPKKKTSFIANYYELVDKRLNNELFKALEKKGYTTIAISDFNSHTSFNTDYFYDFYSFSRSSYNPIPDKKELRYMENEDNSKFSLFSYMQFNHFRSLLNTTVLYPLFENINYLNYETLDYENFDVSHYRNINQADYWLMNATMKSLAHSSDIDKKFVFIDYKLNHLPLIYDAFGNKLDPNYNNNSKFYLGNYIYASKLLIELLDFIRKMDEDAVVIIQGDHGIHMLEEETIMKQLEITREEVQDIRNSVISAYYIPEKYQNGDEVYLNNPLNVSRYLINNFVGKNYEYIGNEK